MKIENKEKLLYSAESALDYMKDVCNSHKDKKTIFFAVGTAIHWMTDCADRIPKKSINSDDKHHFSGLRCINNCLKHNVTFGEVHEIKGHGYPYRYPYRYGIYYCFPSLDNIKVEEKYKELHERQKKNYDEVFLFENVCIVLQHIMELINKYYAKL